MSLLVLADYAEGQLAKAALLEQQAQQESDPDKKAQLLDQAQSLQNTWGEGKPGRVAAHAFAVSLSGGLPAAAGALTSQTLIPHLDEALQGQGVPQDLRNTLLSAAGLGIGAATGGSAGAAAGLNITANNYLDHRPDPVTGKSEIQEYLEAKNACERGNSQACNEQQAWLALSRWRDAKMLSTCGPYNNLSLECGALTKQAKDMGNKLNLGTHEYKIAGPVARSPGIVPYDLGVLNHPKITSVASERKPSMREQLENGLFRLQDALAQDVAGTGTLAGAVHLMLGGNVRDLPDVVKIGADMGTPLAMLAASRSALPLAIRGGYIQAPTGGAKNLQATVQNNGGQRPPTTVAKPEVTQETLKNLRPQDAVFAQRPIRNLVKDKNGRYWLETPTGNRITPSGKYDFVTMPDGTIRVARPNPNPEYSTHLGLSGGGKVKYAGSIHFTNSTSGNRGAIIKWSNDSGHYQPPTTLKENAQLPINLFNPH